MKLNIEPDVTISRHTSAKIFNEVVNDPSVYDWVRGPMTGELDLSPVVENENNILLMGAHGGMLFICKQAGIYDIHTSVLPSGRGEWCLKFTREALRWMFTKTPAVELTSRVPKGNLGALALVRANKMVKELHLEQGWFIKDDFVPADVYSINVQSWIPISVGTPGSGKWFVDRLAEEYNNHGVRVNHQIPDGYLPFIGSATEMIFGGQKEKGVVFYNRWAGMVGTSPARIVTLNPLVVEHQGAIFKFRPNDFWMMSCPSQPQS